MGRPEISMTTSPSATGSPAALGRRVTTRELPLAAVTVTSVASLARTVPRTTTCCDSNRFSTGTEISDGSGGSVSAAISAGDLIRWPASHPSPEDATATPATT